MNLYTRIFDRLRRMTPLESAILRELETSLPADEGSTLALQIRTARIRRLCGGRSLDFSFRRPVQPIERLTNEPSAVLAVATVKGKVSGFRTIASIRLAAGTLAVIDFDSIPWTGHEPLEVQCRICDAAAARHTKAGDKQTVIKEPQQRSHGGPR